VNVVEVAFAGTVTVAAGTGSMLLLLASPTAIPPFGAALFNVIVQLVTAPEFRLVGLHASDDGVRGWDGTRLMVAVCDAPFRLAVKAAVWLAAIFPAVAVNVVEVAFAGTVTVAAGTGSMLLLLARPTAVPPFGAALFNVIVQLVTAPEFRLAGLHASEDSVSGWDATRLMVAVREAPFRLAVKVALWLEAIVPAVAVNVMEVLFTGTVTEGAGTGSRLLLLAKFTTVPPFAAWLRVTLQVVADPEFTLVGLQTSDDSVTGVTTGATKLTVADWETRPGTTAEASFEFALSMPVPSTTVVT
jgi:hypothetical protein